jgi:hypothetical protein
MELDFDTKIAWYNNIALNNNHSTTWAKLRLTLTKLFFSCSMNSIEKLHRLFSKHFPPSFSITFLLLFLRQWKSNTYFGVKKDKLEHRTKPTGGPPEARVPLIGQILCRSLVSLNFNMRKILYDELTRK